VRSRLTVSSVAAVVVPQTSTVSDKTKMSGHPPGTGPPSAQDTPAAVISLAQIAANPIPTALALAMASVEWELSLRAEQPIEGCELFPHPYIKIKNTTFDNPTKAKVSIGVPSPSFPLAFLSSTDLCQIFEANPHLFVFEWSRGPVMKRCQNETCPRRETFDPLDWSRFSRGGPPLRCSVCEKANIPLHETLFCSER
jgi:hypothetical protein